ncbi:DUF3102 domain-containing protein [Staphylococcus carnosus]|uniref:DUF3102 domain-containing protein n=1 Tax=Staphylococcus carnosus TaxID=1281 RepID=A0AAJ0JML2_STACA|nr:DUF3102 domain-containing protein [Staphylococcus carnosus]KKB24441.1 hypothetical protein VV61_12005 [Staphylococcus carnosus]PNZ97233.1 DUF3102 domain-containing protein [Staphylococcus carnosus]QQS85552.1 DUF3102 domain-containing protein [Staphylococcus carnosus]QRQ05491.1 DUF3102 domain-containing protein [Staphylococcus carnosus]UTB82510.1 hypothetical protein A2I67_04010 [Staphylococcus carnosus]
MNELQLSDDLTTIETEIKSYQNIAGQSIFEIGRRLKHVKENDLVHGEFGKWLENVGMHKQQAQRFIKIADEFRSSNATPVLHLGIKALYQLATMPEEQRNHAIEHGIDTDNGKKSIDEVTTREIEDYKRQLKQRDEEKSQLQSQVEQAQRSESIARKQLEETESREPEVIEKYMEPEDYEEIKESNKQLKNYLDEVSNHNKKLNADIEKLKSERSETDEKSQKYDELNKAINSMNTKLNEGQQKLKAQKEIYDLVKGSEKVIREVAPLCYLAFSKDIIDNDYAREPIEKIITDLTDMAQRLQKQIKQGDVIDV